MGPFSEVIIGATDVAETVAFLELFDFVPVATGDHLADGVPGSDVGLGPATRIASRWRTDAATLLVVPTRHHGRSAVGWECGPRALDVYTLDLDATLVAAVDAGFEVSPVGGLAAGPMVMRQAMVHGPGDLSVVFVESTHRRSSVLDDEPAGPHSEPHSVVWVVDDHVAEVSWWTTGGWTSEGQWDAGLTAGNTIGFAEPTISDELGLPERPTPITMTMLSDPAVEPIRLELMTFDDHVSTDGSAEDRLQAMTLRSGLFALVVDGAGGESARLVSSPGGVRVLLRP